MKVPIAQVLVEEGGADVLLVELLGPDGELDDAPLAKLVELDGTIDISSMTSPPQ